MRQQLDLLANAKVFPIHVNEPLMHGRGIKTIKQIPNLCNFDFDFDSSQTANGCNALPFTLEENEI